jgi:hypothetical protein
MLVRNVRTGTDAISGLPSQAILSVSSVDVMKLRKDATTSSVTNYAAVLPGRPAIVAEEIVDFGNFLLDVICNDSTIEYNGLERVMAFAAPGRNMTVAGPDFRQTWLWRQAFLTPRSDSTTDEQDFFRTQYLSTRDRVAQLVSRIATDVPGLTVHDISHLDALWDTASSVAEGAVSVNPAEAFVFGASILLHDAAMSLAAYPGGLAEVRATIAWKDAIATRIV